MKRIILSCLIVCMILSCPVVAVFARDAVIVPPKLIETLEEYQEVQKEYPPVGGITWDKFSMLGEYIPQEAFKNIEDRIIYQYGYGERTYYLTINDLSLTFTNLTNGVEPDLERNEYWQQYLPVIDQMTTREFLEVRNAQPNWAPNSGGLVWMKPNNSDLTIYFDESSTCYVCCVNDNLVFSGSYGNLVTITWIYNGLVYQLNCQDEYGNPNFYEHFNETDIDIVRRLTNLETCEEALNELMSKISDNVVSEMPKGMPHVDPNHNQEINGTKDPNTIDDINHADQKKAPYWHIVFLIGAVALLGTVTTILWQTARKKNAESANGNYDK